jgi:hypothetical protein
MESPMRTLDETTRDLIAGILAFWSEDDDEDNFESEDGKAFWRALSAYRAAHPDGPDPAPPLSEAQEARVREIARGEGHVAVNCLDRWREQIASRLAALEAARPAPTCTGCEDRIADSDYHSCVPSEPGSSVNAPQKMGRGADTITELRAAGAEWADDWNDELPSSTKGMRLYRAIRDDAAAQSKGGAA